MNFRLVYLILFLSFSLSFLSLWSNSHNIIPYVTAYKSKVNNDKSNNNNHNNDESDRSSSPNHGSPLGNAAASHHPGFTPQNHYNPDNLRDKVLTKEDKISKSKSSSHNELFSHSKSNDNSDLVSVAKKLANKLLQNDFQPAEQVDLDNDGEAETTIQAELQRNPDGTIKIQLHSPNGLKANTNELDLETVKNILLKTAQTLKGVQPIASLSANIPEGLQQSYQDQVSHHNLNNNHHGVELHDTTTAAQSLYERAQTILNATDQGELLEAISLYEAAANLNHSDANLQLGEIFLFGDTALESDFVKAEHYFNRSAFLGNPAAQHYLAFLYFTGLSPSKGENQQLSLLYDQFAAFSGYEPSQLTLGYRHFQGINLAKSCESAVYYYQLVAQTVAEILADDPHYASDIDRARLIDERSRHSELTDDDDIIHYYKASAAAGDIQASLTLGNFAQHGLRGMDQNPELAAQYYQRAVEGGDPNAMAQLAQMHIQGLGVSQDNETALELFKESAKRGSAAAANGLGVMYLHGIGTEKNHKLALQWFRRSADAGYSEGMFNLGVMLFQGLGVEQQLTSALQYFHLAALQGHTRAQFNVGSFHLAGLGTPKSCSQALAQFKQVSEKSDSMTKLTNAHKAFLDGDYNYAFILYALTAFEGNEIGQSNAAWLLNEELVTLEGYFKHKALQPNANNNNKVNQENIRANPSSSVILRRLCYRFLELSAGQGSVDNLRIMGDYHYYGLLDSDSSPNYEISSNLYQQASDRRSAQASFNLGYMYSEGIGIPIDYPLAKRYLDLALELDPNAYVPVKLALSKLQAQHYFNDLYDKWILGKTTQTTNTIIADIHNQATNTQHNLSSHSWNYDYIENIVLAILCASLAIVIYIRSQRM